MVSPECFGMRNSDKFTLQSLRDHHNHRAAPICPYAHIWPYGHMGIWAYAKKYGQMGYPRKENQKSSSEMLSRGPQDTPIKNYGQKSILGNFTMYIPLSTSDGWRRGIYGSINLKKIMKPSFDQPKNISDHWIRNQFFFASA